MNFLGHVKGLLFIKNRFFINQFWESWFLEWTSSLYLRKNIFRNWWVFLKVKEFVPKVFVGILFTRWIRLYFFIFLIGKISNINLIYSSNFADFIYSSSRKIHLFSIIFLWFFSFFSFLFNLIGEGTVRFFLGLFIIYRYFNFGTKPKFLEISSIGILKDNERILNLFSESKLNWGFIFLLSLSKIFKN